MKGNEPSTASGGPENSAPLDRQVAYYKKRLDELAGQNMRLDYLISGLQHGLKQKKQGFALLTRLHEALGQAKETSHVLELTVQWSNSTLGMDKTIVLTPGPVPLTFHPTHALGFSEDQKAAHRSVALEFPETFLVRSSSLLVNSSVAPAPLSKAISEAFELPYFVAVPIVAGEETLGVIISGRQRELVPLFPPLDEGDLDTFTAVAGLVGAIVRNMQVSVLEEMDRLKTAFFANISHEFRTPITLTMGPIESLLAGRYGTLPMEHSAQLGLALRNQERLLVLVNQLLDLAKIEAGKTDLRFAGLRDLNQFIDERLAIFQPLAEARHIELELVRDERCSDLELFVDHEKLDQVVLNLLSNAHKFTLAGRITVTTDVTDDLRSVAFTVADTGVGIKAEDLPHVFDRFRQSDQSEQRGFAGTGIGLALVREVVKAHAGNVTVQSRYGEGSSFCVALPLGKDHLNPDSIVEPKREWRDAQPSGAPRRPHVEALSVREGGWGSGDLDEVKQSNDLASANRDQKTATVLFVDDNYDLRVYVRDLLASTYNVFLATDGQHGLEMAKEHLPDLILSDLMMPRMSGLQLCQKLKEDPNLANVPFVLLTAKSTFESKIEILEQGADDYLAKPFSRVELFARIGILIAKYKYQQALARSNRDLDSFAAVASHDLQAPLRKIETFSQMLTKSLLAENDDESKDYAERIGLAVRRMRQFVTGLLAYSRLAYQEKPFTMVDVGSIVAGACEDLEVSINESGAAISVGELPTVEGDEVQLHQLFANILTNALRYRHPQRRPEIRVSSRHLEGSIAGAPMISAAQPYCEITVEDNGLGFDNKNADRIFIMFHRLHTHSKIPGTGMGLAICRRIVERHGGTIRAMGTVDVGARFIIALPLPRATELSHKP